MDLHKVQVGIKVRGGDEWREEKFEGKSIAKDVSSL